MNTNLIFAARPHRASALHRATRHLRAVRRTAGLLTATLLISAGATPGSAEVQSEPRSDENSKIAHRQLLEKKGKGQIDLYFAGDSITRRWGCTDPQYRDLLEHWREHFHGWNAANFAWGGDRVQNILWRLENGELDGVNPKAIVLMAGTNNLGGLQREGEDAKVREIVDGIAAILNVMDEKAPDAKIILMGITPRRTPPNRPSLMPVIQRINERLASLADERGIRFINLNDKLTDAEGNVLPGATVDGLHLSKEGYEVWAQALKPVLTGILGERAEIDHAPPPTGDPSAG